MECKYCNRQIFNKGSLKSHEMCCKQNPNRIQHKHSHFAGAKKGTPSPHRGKKVGRNPIWDKRYPLDSVLVADSTYPRRCLRKRIIDEELIEYRCARCGINPEWMGKPMPLILDHINGKNNDNRLNNLRFVCSNCDSQLPTYKSRNRKKRYDFENF